MERQRLFSATLWIAAAVLSLLVNFGHTRPAENGGGRSNKREVRDEASAQNIDVTMIGDSNESTDGETWPWSLQTTCPGNRALDLPKGTVGDTVNASCHSGLFEGLWNCEFQEERNVSRWKSVECRTPEGLQFAGSSDFFSAGLSGALRTVNSRMANKTLNLSTAAFLIRQISSIEIDDLNSSIVQQDSDSGLEMVFDVLSSYLEQTRSLTKKERVLTTSRLLTSLDLLALKYVKSSTYIDYGFTKMKVRKLSTSEDVLGIQVGENAIVLPTLDLQKAVNQTSVKEVSFLFEDLSSSLFDTETDEGQVITPVISTALLCGNDLCDTSHLHLSRMVKIVLERPPNLTTKVETLQCYFWELAENLDSDDSLGGYWSQRGCTLNRLESVGGKIVCECTHLTHFAVLLSPRVEIKHKHVLALGLVGYIGVPFSLVAMAITVLIYGCFRSLWDMRSYIHVNLCLSLIAAQLLFIVGIERTENQIVCSIVAVILHYLFLVSFMWMLMEGVVLYILLVKVFVEGSQKRYIIWFTTASYGLPALYMCLTVPLGFLLNGERHYGSHTMCWLRYDTHFVWTFIAPIILIITINMILLIMAFVIIYKHQKKRNRVKDLSTIRNWIKSAISLVTVMGLTWITGVLVFDETLITFAYIFAILVALQGFAIFILFVVMSKQVIETILKYAKSTLKMECLNECVDNRKKELTFNKSGTGTRGQTSWLRKESSSLEDCQATASSRISEKGSTELLHQN